MKIIFISLSFYSPRGPLRWLDPGAFGTLGVGGGFALGAKLCRPTSDVWIIYGDGSCGYSVAEFDTCTRHNVILLIFFDLKPLPYYFYAHLIQNIFFVLVCG